jgi:eukaryotic-like serine/threonine-protein kinase
MLGSLQREGATSLTPADSGAEFVFLRGAPSWRSQLLLSQNQTINALAFDPNRMQPLGAAVPINLRANVDAQKHVSLSVGGNVIAYAEPPVRGAPCVEIVSRGGAQLERIESADDFGTIYVDVRASPQGRQVAMTSVGGQPTGTRSIWLYDLDHQTRQRLTAGSVNGLGPVWSPEGSRLAFASNLPNRARLIVRTLTGAGRDDVVWTAEGADFIPMDWSRDGQLLLMMSDSTNGSVISVLPLEGNRLPRPVISSASHSIGNARFSRSGRWVSYVSAEYGRRELWVAATADGGRKRQVSHDGAFRAVWHKDGRELFYVNADERVMAVPVDETTSEIQFGRGRPLFSAALGGIGDSLIDVMRDGRQFVLIDAGGPSPYRLHITDVATEAKRLGWMSPIP